MSREPLHDVLARRTPALLALPGVRGTGEGRDEAGEPVLVVFVATRTPALDARLPRVLDGYRVVVRESGEVTGLPR